MSEPTFLRRRDLFFKTIAGFLLLTFSTFQFSWAHEPGTVLGDTSPIQKGSDPFSEARHPERSEGSQEDGPFKTSTDFLAEELILEPLRHPEAPEGSKDLYESERYALESALDLMRPDFASAVILEKPLSAEDFEKLFEHSIKEGIEIAVLILHGETVLISSGNEDEITASQAGREILKEASFSLHTHPDKHLIEGPSLADLLAAEADTHYVLTTEQAYGYTEAGVIGTGDTAWLYERYVLSLRPPQDDGENRPRELSLRWELNQLIAEQDRLNALSEEEKETWLAGSTGLSYTSGLAAANVTALPGTPFPYLMAGSSAATGLTYSSDQFSLAYNVIAAGSYSAQVISFDDASTSTVETKDLSSLTSIIFGIKGPSAKLHVDFVDVNGNKDRFTLKNISSSERYWKILTSSLVSSVNKTKIKEIRLIVDQTTASSSTRTGTEVIRIKGLNVNAPTEPVITSQIPEVTSQSTLTLAGTKAAHTSVLINGTEVIGRNASTTWSYTVSLYSEGNNLFNIQTKNTIGKLSTAKSVALAKDTVAPAGSIDINSGASYTFSRDLTLALTGSDATSGLDRMRFSIDAGQTWTAWEAVLSSKSITLTGEDGPREVWYQLKDKAGNTASFKDTLRLHTAPASYYVSKTGSDTQTGSEASPWQSIQYAVSQLLPGDTLSILEGVYEESVNLVSSGLPNAPITIQGIGNVTIDGQNFASPGPGFSTQGHDYLAFKDLTLKNLTAGIDVKESSEFIEIDGIKSEANSYAVRITDANHVTVKNAYATNSKNAFRITGTSHDILLEKVEAHDSLDNYPGFNPDYLNGDGVIAEAGVNRLTIRNSTFGNNADAGIDFKGTNGLFENITAYGNKNNFKMWGTATLQNSLSHHAKRQARSDGSTVEGNGITVEAGNTKLVNVTLADNEDHDVQVYAAGNLTVENSIVARRNLDPTGMLLESAGIFTSQNVLWYAKGRDPALFQRSPTDLWDDPQFVDWRSGDYRLGYASPAVGLGAYGNQTVGQKPLPFQEFEAALVIEAEHPYAKLAGIAQDWILDKTLAGYSGGGYFFADPDSNSTYNDPSQYLAKSPELRYEVQIQNPGIYYVWVRAYAAEGKSDSVHVGLDGLPIDTSDRIYFKDKSIFSWSNRTMDLDAEGRSLRATLDISTAGTHLLNVWMREDGLRFDKILLTQDPNFKPRDLGPEESWRVDTVPPQGRLEIPTTPVPGTFDVLLNETDESSGVGAVRFSEDGIHWRDWETYRGGPKTVTLTGANGIRKLFAQLRDRAGNVGEVLEEEFILYALPSDGSLVTLKTEEGFVLNYLAGVLFSVEKPEEYTLIRPELDANQNLTGGLILFSVPGTEGTWYRGSAYYTGNKIQWNQTPQGDRYSYNAEGRVIKIRDRAKKEIDFTYTLDAENRVQSIRAQADGFTSTYSSEGKLLEVLKQNGERLHYNNGILSSVTLAGGNVISYSQAALPNGGTRVTLNASAPVAYPQSMDYDLQGEITKIVKQTSEQILFENGVPTKFIDQNGIESAYSYAANSGGDLTGLALTRLGYTQHFDTQGNLFAIDLAASGVPAQRFVAQDGKITKIILTDGTTVELGEEGYETNSDQINSGTVHFADGSQAKYQDSQLIEIITKDGVSYTVTLQGENYLATKKGNPSSGGATQFILDRDLNVLELTQSKDIVRLRDNLTEEILPNCNPATDSGCEEARFFYYLPDRTVVVQGNFSSKPALETLNTNSGVSYSVSTFDLQGQPLGMKTYEGTKLTRVEFAYGKIRHVFNCNLDETGCIETLRYGYEFDALGNEITVVTELTTETIRRYRENLLVEALTKDNVLTAYAHDSKKRVLTSQMTWQGKTLESYSYEYDEANKKTKITDKEGVTRIYDSQEKLVGIIQGNQEFSILHFTQNGVERTAQGLVKETTDSGLIFHYQMGEVTKIEYPDGRILEEIVEDEKEGKIFSAKVRYPDGTWERVVSGQRVEIRRPDGSVWEYEYGRMTRHVDTSGRTFIYWYDKNYVKLYEEAAASMYRYNLQGQYLQTDSGTGIAPASLDPLTLSLATISYEDLATNLTKTKTDGTSDLFKAKIVSSEGGRVTLETVHADQLIYQSGKLAREIEAGTGHTKEYSYDADTTILKESGSVQYFNAQKKLFRFVDFNGVSYDVTPDFIQSVTGGTAAEARFLDIHFDLESVRLNLSEVKIQGSAQILKEGNFSVRLQQGTNPQDRNPPQIYVTSPRIIDSPNYTMVYKVDGVEKSESVTLVEGPNPLTIEAEDASGNRTTLEYEVTYVPPVPFEEKDGRLVIEAENPHASMMKAGQSWEFESSRQGASGAGYLVAGPDVGKTRDTDYLTNSPELQYKVQITNPGTYYVWIKGFGANGASDTVHVGLDGQAIDSADRINFWPNGKWIWSKSTSDKDAAGKNIRATIEITTAGVHTLNVWMREDGLVFDKILLTKDPNFIPQDLGPAESFRNYTPPVSNPISMFSSLFEAYQKAQRAPEEVRYSIFDQEGKLVYTEKINGSVTEYVQGRITSVWDRTGRLLQSYEYSEAVPGSEAGGGDSDPIKINLHRMRAEFPAKIQKAKEEVELQKNEALRGLAEAQASAVLQIQQTYAAQRTRLEAQRSNLEAQRFQTQCQQMACFETCRTVEVPGVAEAIHQANAAISDLNAQEAQAYANLRTEVGQAMNTIDTEVTKAFETIDDQEREFRDEILRQEISPIVFHYYRQILGRDPNQAEYDRWIDETDFNVGLDVARLKNFLTTTPELGQRQTSVSQIKTSVTEFINDYKTRSAQEKISIAQTQLGLAPEDLAFFTSSEADKILEWVNSRSLHFGQSAFIALEKMLEQAGLEKVPGSLGEAEVPGSFSRERLATRLILTDILAGIITPFDEGELLLSLFAMKHVASLYGLNTQGVNTLFEDLASFYQTHPGHRMIAHINGNHYVIVTGIQNGKVTYIDPGAGPEGNNQIMEVSQEEFQKAWDGNVLVTQTTSQVLIQQHSDDPNLKANPPPEVLSTPELQSVRGSFFFFLIPFFTAIWAGIKVIAVAVWTAVTLAIDKIALGISQLLAGEFLLGIQTALGGIVSGLQTLAGAFVTAATGILQTIPFIGPALSGVVGVFGDLAVGFISKAGTFFVSKVLGSAAAQFVVKAAMAFSFLSGGVEGILTAIGIPPKAAHYIGMAISIIGALATGNPVLVASTLASIAVTELGPRIGLSPALTSALSIATSALAGTIAGGAFNPNATVFQALKDAAPKLAGSFAQAGILGIGELTGLDPRLSSILGSFTGNAIGGLFNKGTVTGYRDDGTPMTVTHPLNRGSATLDGAFQGLKQVLLGNARTVGIDFGGKSTHPLFGSLRSHDFLGSIESALGKQNLFSGIFDVLKEALLSPFNLVNGIVRTALTGVTDFDSVIRQKGLSGAFQSLVTSIFKGKAIETISQSGGISGILGSVPKILTTLATGEQGYEQRLDDQTSLFYNLVGNFIGKKEAGLTQTGTFGVDSLGKWALVAGRVVANLLGGIVFAGDVTNGQLMRMSVSGSNGVILTGDPEGQSPIIIKGPDEPDSGGQGSFWGAILRLIPYAIKFFFSKGSLNRAEADIPQSSSPNSQTPSTEELYILVDGVGDSRTSIQNLETDLIQQSHGEITDEDVIPTSVLDGETVIQKGIDILKWALETQVPGFHLIPALQIFGVLKSHFLTHAGDLSRPLVGMGYSGGLLPLVEAVLMGGYNVASMVGLGAVTLSLTRNAATAVLKTIKLIEDKIADGIEALLKGVGFLGSMISQILNAVQNQFIDSALELLIKGLSQAEKILPTNLPSLAGKAEQIVNVWGTEDDLYKAGLVGERENYLGVETVNIEIVGADHFDYMRRSDADAWNLTVSRFVADLLIASKTKDELKGLLDSQSAIVTFDPSRNVYVVNLPGHP